MSFLLAIDPSIIKTGWAVFEDRELIGCGAIIPATSGPTRLRELADNFWTYHFQEVVVEWPRHRPGRRGARVADLITLGAAVGAVVSAPSTDTVHTVFPEQWKGQLSKKATAAAVYTVLSEEEQDALALDLANVPKSAHSDVLDAIGIGLYWLNRAPWRRRKR